MLTNKDRCRFNCSTKTAGFGCCIRAH